MATPETAPRWSRAGVVIALLVVAIATVATTAMRMTLDISLSTLPYAAVGTALVWRRRGEAVGWVLLAFAVFWSVTFLATELALSEGTGSLVVVASWLSEWTWVLAVVSVFVVLPIVFPTGEPHRRSWRAVLWLALGLVVVYVAMSTIQSEFSANDVKVVENPWALLALSDAEDVLFPLVLPLLLAGPFAAVMRYRRAAEAEREQIRWFMYAVVVTAVVFFGVNVAESLAGSLVETVSVILALSLPPVGIWIAITRHRLYDLDRLLSRTVSYGLVTALLVGLFFGSVFVSSVVLPVAGDLPVAVATLLAAALFNPLRRRIQDAVDRQFNRARYDARRFVESFNYRLRAGEDLEAVSVELQEAVLFTMQPKSLSIWLRDPNLDSIANLPEP